MRRKKHPFVHFFAFLLICTSCQHTQNQSPLGFDMLNLSSNEELAVELQSINNGPFLSKKDRKAWFKTYKHKDRYTGDIEAGEFTNSDLERRFRNSKFKEKFRGLEKYNEWAGSLSPEERDSIYQLYPTLEDYQLAQSQFNPEIQAEPDTSSMLNLSSNEELAVDRNKNFVRVSRYGKWGYIDDETRTLAIDLVFEHVGHFSEYLAPASIIAYGEEVWGYIDTLGQWIIAPRFDEAKDFSEGFAGVNIDGLWGYIDHSGHFAIQPQYSDVYEFSEGLAGVFDSEKKFQYIDKNGTVVIKNNSMNDGSGFSDGLARVWSNWKSGFINRKGDYIIQPQYGNAQDFSDGMAAVKVVAFFDGKWGYIDENNNIVIKAQYERVGDFAYGYACVTLNDKCFIIDKNGNVVSDIYDMIREYCDGLAPASKNGKWGFVNRAGELIIPLQYDEVVPFGFNNGHCWVILGNNMIKIDPKGNALMHGPRN